MERAKLIELTHRFTDAFNRNDLDAVMAFFADDAVYDEFNGKRTEGQGGDSRGVWAAVQRRVRPDEVYR